MEHVLDGRVDPETRLALWEASRGNLLFLRELVRDGLRRGLLQNDGDGAWRWSRPADPPASVRELIGRQVQHLSEEARHALELVALAEPLEWRILVELAGVAVADELVDDGELLAERDGRRLFARFSHPLVGEVVRAAIPEPRRRRLLLALVGMLPHAGRRRTDPLRRVTWLVDADADVDTQELVAAARQVMLLDSALAERFASLARTRGGGTPAVLALAQNLMFSRRALEVETVLAEAMRDELPTSDRSRSTIMRANNLTYGLSNPAGAIAVLETLLPVVDDDDELREVRSQRLTMLLFAGRTRDLIAESEPFLADDQLAAADRMRVLIALIPALAASGRPETAVPKRSRRRGLVAAAQADLPYALGQLAAGAILALHWSARLDEADALAQLGHDEGTRQHAQLLRGVSAFHLALGAYWRGAMQTAERLFEEAVAALRHTDVGFLPSAGDHLVAVRALLGNNITADATVDDDTRFPLYETERLRLAGVTAAARGDLRAACDLAGTSGRCRARRGHSGCTKCSRTGIVPGTASPKSSRRTSRPPRPTAKARSRRCSRPQPARSRTATPRSSKLDPKSSSSSDSSSGRPSSPAPRRARTAPGRLRRARGRQRHARRRTARALRRRDDTTGPTGPRNGRRARAHEARAGDLGARGERRIERGDRRPVGDLGPDRRDPSPARLRQARRRVAHGVGHCTGPVSALGR